MSTAVVIAVIVLLLAAAGDRGDRVPPSDEQLRRDTEDIALYGAVVRPRLKDDDEPDDVDLR